MRLHLHCACGYCRAAIQLKPNILDEINNDPTASASNPPVDGLKAGQFVSESDHVVLEDESGRVTLKLSAQGKLEAYLETVASPQEGGAVISGAVTVQE